MRNLTIVQQDFISKNYDAKTENALNSLLGSNNPESGVKRINSS